LIKTRNVVCVRERDREIEREREKERERERERAKREGESDRNLLERRKPIKREERVALTG
jgi:hypothetical protein